MARTLLFLLLIIGVVLAATPVHAEGGVSNFIILVDTSGSLSFSEFNTIADAIKTIVSNMVTGEEINVILFNNLAYPVVKQKKVGERPIEDAESVSQKILSEVSQQQSDHLGTDHHTNIALALKMAAQQAAVSEVPTFIFLLSDGQEDARKQDKDGRWIPMSDAEKARSWQEAKSALAPIKRRTSLHVIGFKDRKGVSLPYKVTDKVGWGNPGYASLDQLSHKIRQLISFSTVTISVQSKQEGKKLSLESYTPENEPHEIHAEVSKGDGTVLKKDTLQVPGRHTVTFDKGGKPKSGETLLVTFKYSGLRRVKFAPSRNEIVWQAKGISFLTVALIALIGIGGGAAAGFFVATKRMPQRMKQRENQLKAEFEREMTELTTQLQQEQERRAKSENLLSQARNRSNEQEDQLQEKGELEEQFERQKSSFERKQQHLQAQLDEQTQENQTLEQERDRFRQEKEALERNVDQLESRLPSGSEVQQWSLANPNGSIRIRFVGGQFTHTFPDGATLTAWPLTTEKPTLQIRCSEDIKFNGNLQFAGTELPVTDGEQLTIGETTYTLRLRLSKGGRG